MLLIDFLEEKAAVLRELKEKLQKMEQQYRRIYDRDLKKEMLRVRQDIARTSSEVTDELLLNLDEFRALNKYYPELLRVYMEDEYIGKVVSKKAWLLEFRPIPAQEAAARLAQLREWRAQLVDARDFLKRWVGRVDARSMVATFPVLRGHMKGKMDRDEAALAIDKAKKTVLREGWLLLINDSLIQIPITKFMGRINNLLYMETQAEGEMKRSLGRGTVAETRALRKFQEISKKRQHYERVLKQLLLANPKYLKAMKKKKNWLSKERSTNLDRIVQSVTPHTVKERSWLNEMNKKIEGK